MEKRIKREIAVAWVFVAIMGTLGHFMYEWTGNNRYVGLLVSVNESTWEHMKLLFFPMLLANICLYYRWGQPSREIAYLCISQLIGTWSIPMLFYGYRGILGYGIMAVDILIFYLSVMIAYLYLCHAIAKGERKQKGIAIFGGILILLQSLAFLGFTYSAPTGGIFQIP